jgi:monoamine oxidase
LAKLAEGIPVQLNAPVTEIELLNRGSLAAATTPKGNINGKFIIVTASTPLLAAERIKFDGGLPKRHLDAIDKLKPGSFDHIVLELSGNPLGLQRDELVIEKSSGPRTAALLANMSGTPLAMVSVGGRFGRDLIAKGDKAAVEFAVEWLAAMFGADVKRTLQRTHVTNWNAEPWALGAVSAALPGGQWARKALMESVRGRVYFAGDAIHETMWGTVAGAWESGERAANTVVRRLAGLPEVEPEKPEPAPARRGRQRR